VLISHRLWTSRFAADPNVIGGAFTAYVSDRPEEVERFTIAGVLPQGFWHINSYTEVFAPLRADTYPYMVRLRPGVTAEQAASRITALVTAGARDVPAGWRASVVSTHAAYVEQVRPVLRTVVIAALLVLGVACANVAGLLLVRAVRRQREVAIRTALGAGRGAIARMLLAEGLVLGTLATLLAALAAAFVLDWAGPLVEQQLGRRPPGGAPALRFDVVTMTVAAILGMVTAVTCSLAPLATAARTDATASTAQAHGRSATETRRSRRTRSVLVTLEVATSLALLAGTGLMLRSVHAQLQTDLGFTGDTVLQGSVTLRPSRYPDADARVSVFDRIVGQVGSIAGVESVALTTSWPVQQPRQHVVTSQATGAPVSTRAAIHSVSAAYFATVRIPLSAGRDFAGRDRPGDEPVAVVSETLARRFYPAGAAVGERLAVPRLGISGESLLVSHVIVGVAADVRQGPLDEDLADVYVPLLQAPGRFAFVLVRTPGPPIAWEAPFRGAFRHVDPEIAVHGIRPLQATVDALTAGPRFLATLLAVLGGVCAALTLVGVYGIVAYAVRQREREVAVRLAIGADAAGIMRLFLGEGGRILAGD
jgi:putative ABC transport system permease protein